MKTVCQKTKMMTKSLFDSFDEVSAKQWKQKIQFDLKGADYNEALIFKSLEGIDIKPFYHQEDLTNINNPVAHPATWKNVIKIDVTNATTGNEKARTALQKGAESIFFIIPNETIEPHNLLKDIPSQIPIFIETQFLSVVYSRILNDLAKTKNSTIYVLIDVIGHLAATGNWYKNHKGDHQFLDVIVQQTSHLNSVISVDLGLYQNAGANMVQQLAYSLAHANEYLNYYDKKVFSPFDKMPVVFKVAIGGNYFFEIAKLRALRLLWAILASEYNVHTECYIHAHPSHRNKTILDYNVNMLRTTTECMSAILGGANTIYNLPYDDIYNLENDFGTRISLNQLLILKNESYFDLVANPASGSYYIENITSQLAEKGLALFKELEKAGGFLSQLESGVIQKKIKESAYKEQKLFDSEEIILTGANKYKDPEGIIPRLEKSVFLKKSKRKTRLAPIIKTRLSEKTEKKT